MPTAKSAQLSHFAYIDATRGVAFLAVLCLHAANCVGDFQGRAQLLLGGYGVQLFFLASAITLCHSMTLRNKYERHPIMCFYIRRLFRIAPLFWAAIVFYWVIWPNVQPSFWLSQFAPDGVGAWQFSITALFLHGWHPYTFNSIVPGGWSIAVEMTFYAIFPLLFSLLDSVKKSLCAVTAGFILAHLNYSHLAPALHSNFYPSVPLGFCWLFFQKFWPPAEIGVFFIGFLAYHLLTHQRVASAAKNRLVSYSVLLFSICMPLLLPAVRSSLNLFALSMAAGIVSISGGRFSWLVNRTICKIGKLSYSCYLVHFAALGITLKLLGIHLSATQPICDTGDHMSNLSLFLKIVSISLGLTIVFSICTLTLLENPGIGLGKRTIQWIEHRSKGSFDIKTRY